VGQDVGVSVSTDRLEALFRVQSPRLWRSLFSFTGDPDVASDALGEAFAQALARGDAIRDASAWVWRVAFIVARGEMKRRPTPTLAPHGSYEMPDPLPDLFAALAKISPNQRLAVVLHDYADRPTDEIARIIGASRATVHVHLSAGRRRLRHLLEAKDG